MNVRNGSPILAERRNILLENNIGNNCASMMPIPVFFFFFTIMCFFVVAENNHNNVRATSDSEINKTESCVPFSPSTALSQLDLNVNKKLSKIKKRFVFLLDLLSKNFFIFISIRLQTSN